MSTTRTRTIKTDALARVEGEGAMYVRIRDGAVEDVKLRIYEPPRFFEAFLRGRRFSEAPDITARICGICPVAYQTSAFNAIETAFGVEPSEEIGALRRLMYCGEWIESHALHVFMLHAPDFLGYQSAWAMAADHPEAVEGGLAIKKAGNDLLRVIGGRAIHPVNVRVGGFYRAPSRTELGALVPQLERARELMRDSVRWVAALPFPDFESEYEFVALRDPDRYAIENGRLVSSSGLDLAADQYEEHFVEYQVEHSTALHSRLRDGGSFFLGPMARYSLNSGRLSPLAREAAAEAGLGEVCTQPVQEHHRPSGRDPLRARRGAAADRLLPAARSAGVGARGPRRDRLRVERGAARHALAPLPAGGRRVHRRGADRAAHLPEPGPNRAGPARVRAPSRRPG